MNKLKGIIMASLCIAGIASLTGCGMSNAEAKGKAQELANKYANIIASKNDSKTDRIDGVTEDRLKDELHKALGDDVTPTIQSSRNDSGEVSVNIYVYKTRLVDPSLEFDVYGFAQGKPKEEDKDKSDKSNSDDKDTKNQDIRK